jgi:hypothetical protein
MTTSSDHGNDEEKMLEALRETWGRLDATFHAEPAPRTDWMAMVRERRLLANRKFWTELAILWSVAIPLLGVMFLLITGMQTMFWILESVTTATAIPLLVSEFKRASRSTARGEI